MRPLPRVLAFTHDAIAARDDFGIRAAAVAAAGSSVALVARLPHGSADALAGLASRCVALAKPPEAAVFVTARADVALATRAAGVILRRGDLAPGEARAIAGNRPLRVLRSVHAVDEAEAAIRDGVDALIVGTIWPSASHPDGPVAGIELLRAVAALGTPTYAIGGVTVARAAEARDAGAWGVAAIGALWEAEDGYVVVREMMEAMGR